MIYLREGLLTPSECEAVRGLFPPIQPATVNSPKSETRRSRTAFLTPAPHENLCTMISTALFTANKVFNFEIASLEPFQLAEYREGDFYDWHCDIGRGAMTRKLSASLQLTDPNEYDGGALELWGAAPINRTQGALLVFPSYTLHRVTPVTRGVRHSLVAWATGTKPFR